MRLALTAALSLTLVGAVGTHAHLSETLRGERTPGARAAEDARLFRAYAAHDQRAKRAIAAMCVGCTEDEDAAPGPSIEVPRLSAVADDVDNF